MRAWSPQHANDTSSEESGSMNVRPRKSTYYARKDEIEALHDQVHALEASLHGLTADRDADAAARLAASATLHTLLEKGIQHQVLQLAGAQSLLSSYNTAVSSQDHHQPRMPIPLKTCIHLPANTTDRNAVLATMRAPKLLAAFQFMAARTRFHDLRVMHHNCEQSRLLNGDLVATVFSVVQFDQGHSLRQVYNAYDFFATNQEISVSENLGALTICENDPNSIADTGGQMRFVSTPIPGLEVDANFVRFTTCFDATDDTPAYALGTLDFVDHDELYPYQPHRARKETTSAWLMVEVPSATNTRVVAMARWSHSRICPPGPLPKAVEPAVTASMLHWCDLMPQIMAERLATQAPEP